MKGYAAIAVVGALCATLLPATAHAQAFGSQGVLLPVTYPTSLQFGPDQRLYVSEQFGRIHAFTIERDANGYYAASTSETIELIGQLTNHDDDGSACSQECDRRQVTGLLLAGSAEQPILYVTSSDPRVAVANDSGLDTNSGVITRLTCSGGIDAGQCQQWDRVDIVRGLPRSEENHASNGMVLDRSSNTLYLSSGGNTNKGAVSNSFSGTPEYYFSGAVLSIDLDAIADMEAANGGAYVDPRDGTRFVYDLVTLDDPSRLNIDSSHPAFPYPAGHPRRGLQVDLGDPFGGNDGRNQGIPEPGGPVQVHSGGYRNPYDVLLTESGELYTWDNGANSGWGGTPLLRAADGTLKGHAGEPGVVFDPAAGDYCTNELNEGGSSTYGDTLHLITAAGYYGGHPAPIRAFPQLSGIQDYAQAPEGYWAENGPTLRLADLLPAGYGIQIDDFPIDPRQCEYTLPGDSLETVDSSTNGLAEYRADNFNGAMRGDLLAASFNGNLYRCKPDGNGGLVDLPGASTGTTLGRCEVLLGGFGSQPLDVIAQGEDEIFPGTIWAATYGASSIVVFEPIDFTCDPSVPGEDSDADGFSNGDEADNGTNACSAGSKPQDADGDLLSDLNDADDDNDGRLDVDDVFALDAQNGLTTTVPLSLPLLNNDPGTGLFGLGFTGLMLARDGVATWREGYDTDALAAGGTAGLLTVESVTSGTALGAGNTQRHGFLVGVDADATTPPFIVSTRLRPPWFEIGGAASTPQPGQSYGLFVGNGDQDNYASITLAGGNAGEAVIEVVVEVAGNASVTRFERPDWGGQDLLATSSITLALKVDPQASTVQPVLRFNAAGQQYPLGAPLAIPAAWLSGDDQDGFALGAIASSGASASHFGATWDHFSVDFVAGTAPGQWSHVDAVTGTRHEGGFVQAGTAFHLVGGRESDQVQRYDFATGSWSLRAASPIKLHHFQAVELDGLIYAVGAMTGECCAEPPAPNVHLYDPLADRWTTGPAVPAGRARGGGGAVAVDGRIYWISGNTNGHYGPVTDQVDVFDPATGRFTALAPIPHPRDHVFVAAHGGRIYVAGGRDSNAGADGDVFDDSVREIDVYDIASNTWSTLPAAAQLPTARAGAPTAIVGNELIVAGGESGSQATAHAQVEALDLTTLTWRTLAPMLTPRHATQAIVSNHGFYVAAGSAVRGGPDGPLALEALHLYGVTQPTGATITAGAMTLPATRDFGRVPEGGTSVQTVRLTHGGGNQAVIVTSLQLSGSGAFRLVSPPARPFVLAPAGYVELQVEFVPTAQGAVGAQLGVGTSDGSTQLSTLQGEGFGSINATVLHRINVGGPAVAALDAPAPAWQADTLAQPSPYRVAGGAGQFDDAQSGAYGGPVDMSDASVPASAPAAIFQSERWDALDADEMRWEFPVASGSLVEVRLFFAELYSGIETTGERVFDVSLEGEVPPDFAAIDRFAAAGPKGAMMRSALVRVEDGSLGVELLHVQENPAINAIEVRLVEAPENQSPVARDDYARVPAGGSVVIALTANDSDADGSIVAGTLSVLSPPLHGTLQPGAGGQWTYQHGGDAASGDRFTYTVRDERDGISNVATVRIGIDRPTLTDADGDGSADASDPDDDNDGLPDTSDPFARDATNGLGTPLPRRLDLGPGKGGLLDLGFTGVFGDGISGMREGSDYANLHDASRIFISGDASDDTRMSFAAVDAGTPLGAGNTLRQGLQFGVDAHAGSGIFVASVAMQAPFFDGAPVPDQFQGLQLGRGDQDNYVSFVLDGNLALQLTREVDGSASTQVLTLPGVAGASRLTLHLIIDPASGELRAMAAIDAGAPLLLGDALMLPPSWLDAGDARGLALGLVAGRSESAPAFAAHWHALDIARLAEDDVFASPTDAIGMALDVLANDADASGRRIVALGQPDRGGSVAIDDAGTPGDTSDDVVRYSPASGYRGVETFSYAVQTGWGWTSQAVVAITVGDPVPPADPIFGDGFED